RRPRRRLAPRARRPEGAPVIPRRLRLRNFLSYRDCTLYFTRLHLVLLSGKNGHGKSAHIDAITRSTCDRARVAGADGLMHHAAGMLVEFEFEVEGDRFTVVRKRSRGGAAALDFFHVTPGGEHLPLTGGRLADTQRAIQDTVRLDYDTFRNSAFIAQGRADEF